MPDTSMTYFFLLAACFFLVCLAIYSNRVIVFTHFHFKLEKVELVLVLVLLLIVLIYIYIHIVIKE